MLGSGQLGRMFTLAAKRMGYRVNVLSPQPNSPAGIVADKEFVGDYADEELVREFAKSVSVATIEFENIPVATMDLVSKYVPVRPGSHVLSRIQNRVCEKTFLLDNGIPVARFHAIQGDKLDLHSLPVDLFPAVLKTAATGYDGQGQRKVQSVDELSAAWQDLGNVECVLETFVDYECEFSVIVARGTNGEIACYEPILNQHQNHILDVSISPSPLPSAICQRATEIARSVVEALDYVGVMCVEFFLLRDGDVLVNEIAPRPHNSGHLTIEGHATSQFKQQVLSVCGLPLGSTEQVRPAAMANLLGDAWRNEFSDPSFDAGLADVSFHAYGKQEARPGRKMGHMTCLADSAELAAEKIQSARATLQNAVSPTRQPTES